MGNNTNAVYLYRCYLTEKVHVYVVSITQRILHSFTIPLHSTDELFRLMYMVM